MYLCLQLGDINAISINNLCFPMNSTAFFIFHHSYSSDTLKLHQIQFTDIESHEIISFGVYVALQFHQHLIMYK